MTRSQPYHLALLGVTLQHYDGRWMGGNLAGSQLWGRDGNRISGSAFDGGADAVPLIRS